MDQATKDLLSKVKTKGSGKSFNEYLTPEDKAHKSLIEYLYRQYPKVMYIHCPNEGRRSKFESFKFKALGGRAGVSDFLIFDSSLSNKYKGLAIELKRSGFNLKNKKGEWLDEHVEKQAYFLIEIQTKGWYGEFAIGFDEAKALIDRYFRQM